MHAQRFVWLGVALLLAACSEREPSGPDGLNEGPSLAHKPRHVDKPGGGEETPANPAIAYVRSSGKTDRLMVMNSDGSHETEVYRAPYIAAPSWSPGGAGTESNPYSIALRQGEANAAELRVVDVAIAASGEPSRLGQPRTIVSCVAACEPAWSPLGDPIAFSEGSSLSLIPVTGCGAGDRSCVTSLFTEPGSGVSSPAWSKNGNEIALFLDGPGGVGDVWIVVVDAGTGAESRERLPDIDPSLDYIFSIDWARTSNTLAFDAFLFIPSVISGRFVVTWNRDNNQLNTVVEGRTPTWSPQDGRLAYRDVSKVVSIDSDGTGSTQNLANLGLDPDWRRTADEPAN